MRECEELAQDRARVRRAVTRASHNARPLRAPLTWVTCRPASCHIVEPHPYPQPILRIHAYFLRSTLILSSHLNLHLSTDVFPVGLHVIIVNTRPSSSILAKWPAYLNFLDLITLTTLGEKYKL